MARVIVVGAGVAGLSAAVRLLEAGHRVDVLARDLPLETTSAVAAALWTPYLAGPVELVAAWSATSRDVFEGLASTDGTGVRLLPGRESPAAPEDVIYPVIEMPLYLRWLAGRVEDLGGTITRMNLAALPEGADLVVNCSGLGARWLAGDPEVAPVQGQVVVVEQPGLARWALDDGAHDDPTYVIPRSRDIVVGGTARPGEWSRTPDPDVARDILARATRMVPELSGAKVLRHKVGLRPARPEIRVERVGQVIHCYGHGGCGVTVSWGTAAAVAALAG